jgi:hypothetical protein
VCVPGGTAPVNGCAAAVIGCTGLAVCGTRPGAQAIAVVLGAGRGVVVSPPPPPSMLRGEGRREGGREREDERVRKSE